MFSSVSVQLGNKKVHYDLSDTAYAYDVTWG